MKVKDVVISLLFFLAIVLLAVLSTVETDCVVNCSKCNSSVVLNKTFCTENCTVTVDCKLGLCAEKFLPGANYTQLTCVQVPLVNATLESGKNICRALKEWCNATETREQLGIECKYNEELKYCQCTVSKPKELES